MYWTKLAFQADLEKLEIVGRLDDELCLDPLVHPTLTRDMRCKADDWPDIAQVQPDSSPHHKAYPILLER